MKGWKMQVRALSDYKKPHQSGDAWRDALPRRRAGTFLLSAPRCRCATRHCGRDMICWHIRLSALASSSHLAPLSVCRCVFSCVCVCLAYSNLKGKSTLNQGDSILVNTRTAGLIWEYFKPCDCRSKINAGDCWKCHQMEFLRKFKGLRGCINNLFQ